MNRDLFNNADLGDVCRGSMAIISTIQEMKPHTQMASMAATFLFLCERWGMPAHEAFTAVKNMINGADGKRVEFLAVQSYMEHEL